jgi:hypothetical protein
MKTTYSTYMTHLCYKYLIEVFIQTWQSFYYQCRLLCDSNKYEYGLLMLNVWVNWVESIPAQNIFVHKFTWTLKNWHWFHFAEWVWYTLLHCGSACGMSIFLLLTRLMKLPAILLSFSFCCLSYRSEIIFWYAL